MGSAKICQPTPAISLLQVQQGHVLVDVVRVSGTLLSRVLQVGCGTPVDVGLQQLACSYLQLAWAYALVRLHNCLCHTMRSKAITRLVAKRMVFFKAPVDFVVRLVGVQG